MEKIIKKVIESIEKAGFECFIVGGYVRDQLLGNISYDIDICTNALPKDIHNIFNIKTSNNYGGSNLKISKYNIDITTYREETKYISRKPQEVKYINNLEKDLIRRDFTINAICMNSKGHIIDYLNGVEDLNNKILRCIGNPLEKLKEDPLRILRTIRFATLLDFEIESSLYLALELKKDLVKTLSKERIKQEYGKILMSKNFQKGLDLSEKLGLNELLGIEYNNVVYTSDLLGMWSQVKIKDIPFTKEEKSNIIKINEVVKKGTIDEAVLYEYGLYISTVAASIINIDLKKINNIYKKLPINSKKDIAITGEEIINVLNITPGKIINEIINELEELILNRKLKNNNRDIKNYLIKNKGKW